MASTFRPSKRKAIATGSFPRKPGRKMAAVPQMRSVVVWGVLIAGLLGLSLKLLSLQVIQSAELRQKAQQQQRSQEQKATSRRSIVDRQGHFLAVDQPRFTLYAHPIMFKRPMPEIANALSGILGIPANQVMQRFSEGPTGIQIQYSVPEDAARRIQTLSLDGLEFNAYQERIYPQEDLVSEVVGYVNMERMGQSGIEAAYENILERSSEWVEVTRTGEGDILPNQGSTPLLNMDALQLQLTLDTRLQRVSRLALSEQMKQYQAKRGTVIVMDASNGSILSLVQYPSFDANTYWKADLGLLKNWAITDLYEPGSTFKPINVAIALEADAIEPDDRFYDPGQIYIGEWPIQNYDFDANGGRGVSSLTDIIKYSSNVAMVRVVQQMKPEVFYDWLENLGLSSVMGIDLPGETASYLKPKEHFVNIAVEPAVVSFGQGLSLTPLKLAQLHATLANGGFLVTPHVVKGLRDVQGQLHYTPSIEAPRRVFSQETTEAVLAMMEAVVDGGSGKAAQIPNYRVAGKTGTAQKAYAGGGYYESAKITSFVGILPDGPYVVVAVVDEPKGAGAFGGTVSAPIVKSVMEALIPMEKILPSTHRPNE
ncbi:MAG: penicillin-binding protein 2 [Roseofilum sp. SBFL]|uniref:peptidoglycan D,D-transpeptidase FtsI family protein n=1 Tax=unclassified Roseofilum TaxID=2620099 RepID=UPI001B0572AF|nr:MULTISPECIES: penicillin-binding protein 2 [unclassified Roseofilum]MBP0011861.1 penicillin-binding protein 2 [Roseofilum sp. SID3]MBP0024443.1 penicillin-binding protein 2 [Roseofilum sp. SID2]MBP0038655.1 penicillin-binding protein 2 [Roseofilum sp. SID1]MBP0041057.1 penicillin-binding protein 2 [Roseofilum sp. SBFL]